MEIVFETAYDSARKEVLCNVRGDFGMTLKLGTVDKTCLN
jgi:hypothetical protein